MEAIEFKTGINEIWMQSRNLHHNTTSYAEHKALGEFYREWDDLGDKFIETYMGKYGRIDGAMLCSTDDNITPAMCIQAAHAYAMAAQSLVSGDADLMNILADMIELCNHTSYLLTLK